MKNCINCRYGKKTFTQERDRTTGRLELLPYKFICGKPGYGKRKFDVKIKTDCSSFKNREWGD